MYRLTASTTATWGRTAVALPRAGDGGASSPAACLAVAQRRSLGACHESLVTPSHHPHAH